MIVLDVPRPAWNDTVMAAVVFGLDISPDRPEDQGSTIVDLCGSWEKLQQAFTYCTRKVVRPTLVFVAGSLPLDGEN